MSEEEDGNDETMSKREEYYDEGVCMDEEDEPPYELRYNGEGKKIRCNSQEYEEDIV